MIRILYVAPNEHLSTAWWRGRYVLLDLERAYPDEFQVLGPSASVGETVRRCDLLWMMHANSEKFANLANLAWTTGRKYLVDWDDLIWDIPVGNWIRTRVSPEELRLTAELASRACMVTASTQELADYFIENGMQCPVRVFPNMLADQVRWRDDVEPKKIVLWRGGQTHDGDMDEVGADVVALAHDFPDWEWVFAGWDPWRVTRHIPRARWHFWETMPLDRYHVMLAELAPSIVMSPLCDSRFNRCKSRLGVFESAIAGGAFVCPAFPELMNSPGAMHYRHGVKGETFKEVLARAMDHSPDDLRARAFLGRVAIDERERVRHLLPRLREIVIEAVS